MKKISILILALGLIAMFACKKDETKAQLSASPNASVLTVPGGSQMVLLKSDSAVALTYNWTAADFGQTLVTTYTVEMDLAGHNFSNPIPVVLVSNVLTGSINTYDLNQKVLPYEYDPKNPVPVNVEFRVSAIVNANVPALYSAVIAQTITPYYVKIVYPILFVPGNYQGWNPADSNTVVTSLTSNGKYEGYIWFGIDACLFKYTQGPSWTTNWGDNAGNGTLQLNGSNIVAGSRGYYKLDVNLPALTHTFLLTTWTLIGDAASGWSTDIPMAYDTVAKTWSVTLNLSAAGLKFRANGTWDLNYGDDGTNTGKLLLGSANNITVPSAGNYTVTMNLSQPIYKYILKKN